MQPSPTPTLIILTDDLRMLLAQVEWEAVPFGSSKPRGFSRLGLVRIMRLTAVS